MISHFQAIISLPSLLGACWLEFASEYNMKGFQLFSRWCDLCASHRCRMLLWWQWQLSPCCNLKSLWDQACFHLLSINTLLVTGELLVLVPFTWDTDVKAAHQESTFILMLISFTTKWLGSKTVTAPGFTTVPIGYKHDQNCPSSKIFPVQRRADTTSRLKKATRTICHEKWKHCLAYGKRTVSFCSHRFIACILYILLVCRAGR